MLVEERKEWCIQRRYRYCWQVRRPGIQLLEPRQVSKRQVCKSLREINEYFWASHDCLIWSPRWQHNSIQDVLYDIGGPLYRLSCWPGTGIFVYLWISAEHELKNPQWLMTYTDLLHERVPIWMPLDCYHCWTDLSEEQGLATVKMARKIVCLRKNCTVQPHHAHGRADTLADEPRR